MTESNNQSFAALQKQLLHDLFKFTKATTAFEPESLLIHKAEKPTFAEELNKFTEKDLEFFNQLVTFVSSPSQKIVPFKNADDIQERWINVIEAIDTGLELADMALDRVYGRIPDAPSSHLTSIHGNGAHFPSTPSSSSFSSSSSNPSPSPQAMLTTVKHANVSIQVVHANQIVRSQELFKEDVDNSLTRPFIPKLKSKLCSQVPLPVYPTSEHEIKEYNVDHLFPHPYQYEIENLNYPPFLFESVSESPLELPVGLDVSEMEWIDTVEGLEKLIEEIKNEPYIAVDLEHHSYRSYQGFLCLMQITSSHHKDYLVDTLALRMELHQLNRIFADPNILKIFHGADYDIIWLQRDLGCYVVNLFDTFHASKVLQFPTHSLAYLLQHFCQIKTDKKYQLADWRLRPLPQEMVLYARMDTHYLIYIFQKLRQLLSADQLQVVLQKSKDVSLKVHTKWNYDAESGLGRYGWAQLYAKTNRPLDPLRFSVFKHLHQWRDLTAREYDESTGYVLPNSMLLSIATRLPTTTKDVLACCHPIPPMVRTFASDIAFSISRIQESFVDASNASMSSSTTSKQKRSHASMSSVTSSSIDDVNDSSTSLSHLDLNPTFKKRKARFQLTLLQKSSFWDSSASTFRQWQPPSNPVHQNSLKIVLASLNRFDALLPDT